MISIAIVFWAMIIFFAMVGYLRGWQKEVIALSGLVAAMAALNQFGYAIVSLLGAGSGENTIGVDIMALRRQQFWIQAIILALIAFFSYQVVGRLATTMAGGRLGDRLRAGLEKRLVGGIFGAVNGYLVMGGLWGFVEYLVTPNGYLRLPEIEAYPFDPSVIARPLVDSSAMALANSLPQGIFSPTVWLVLFFVTFFIVIVALI
jgi:uncharacterized membrane protein required for colicin V production